MNTNSNTYTVIYTSLVVVVVAALLAFVSQSLKDKQEANDKAETISQILTAAQFGPKEQWSEIGNAATIDFYTDKIENIELILDENCYACTFPNAVYSVSDLKKQNYAIAGKGGKLELPVYVFKNGIKVIPVYGQGLWGPVWGYVAFEKGTLNIIGAYFDHASETPGLGGKIKDDPAFRAQFVGKLVDYSAAKPFEIVKGGAPKDQANAIDAITGATMTSKYLNASINNWLKAYETYLTTVQDEEEDEVCGPDGCCEFKTEEE